MKYSLAFGLSLIVSTAVFSKTIEEREEKLRTQLKTDDAFIMKLKRNYFEYVYSILYVAYAFDGELDYKAELNVDGYEFECQAWYVKKYKEYKISYCWNDDGIKFDQYRKDKEATIWF